jgi:hypothetical protein
MGQKRESKRYVRPTLERLEDRVVPSVDVTYGGGPTIPHVEVNNIVMGPQATDPNALIQALVRDYLPLLGANYGIGAGTLRSSITVAPLPGNPTDGQIQNVLLQEINSGAVPPPNGNQLYFIFLAPGQVVPDVGTIYHGMTFLQRGSSFVPVYYAVDTGNSGASLSLGASHELAEAVTDPDGYSGYSDPALAASTGGGEIADLEEGQMPYLLDGYAVVPLAGPQGQMIEVTPTTLAILGFEEAQALAFHLISSFDGQFTPMAQAANATLNANPLYGAPPGQIGVLYGEALFYNWLSQATGGGS